MGIIAQMENMVAHNIVHIIKSIIITIIMTALHQVYPHLMDLEQKR